METVAEYRVSPTSPAGRLDRFLRTWSQWWYERTPSNDVAPWGQLEEATRTRNVESWKRMFAENGLTAEAFRRPAEPMVASQQVAAEIDYVVARVGTEAPEKRQVRLMNRLGALCDILRDHESHELLPSVQAAVAGLDDVLEVEELSGESRARVLEARKRLEAIGMRWSRP